MLALMVPKCSPNVVFRVPASISCATRLSRLCCSIMSGVPNIERVDRLVQAIAAQRGLAHPSIEETVNRVDDWLVRNRLKG